MAECTKKNACGINVSRLGQEEVPKRGMITIIPLFECDGSIGPQGESRDSRRSIGCGCGYSTPFFPPPLKKKMSALTLLIKVERCQRVVGSEFRIRENSFRESEQHSQTFLHIQLLYSDNCHLNRKKKTGLGGNAKRGMIAMIPLFECDGSISPLGESRNSRRSIGCGCGYSKPFFPSTLQEKMSALM
ncbi:hypothetical protein CEXT_77361 [Caerostris extrusa]|uniref:Uncharacterized protein n=1 Tax=Caerostris extrusa TaxID=172846 RepID=A0AAV4UAJ1_CAEEX|nr:hypothetical protein CEXT_77361 [Caerostris extrusa]